MKVDQTILHDDPERHTIPGTCPGNLSAGATLGNQLRTKPQPGGTVIVRAVLRQPQQSSHP